MKFCPEEECQHYSNATKYPRKCFYGVQCWRGHLDLLIALIVHLKENKRKESAGREE